MLQQVQKITAIFLVGVFVLTSCKDDPSSISNDEPPQIPTAESMEMDFSTFDNSLGAKESVNNQNGENFAQAAFRALIAKAIVNVNLAIPKVLLEAASNSEAELNENEEWEWSYSRSAANQTYEVRLIASRNSGGDVNWEFFVTNPDLNIENKLFFNGTSNSEGTQGVWTYYNLLNSAEDEAVSQISWTVDEEDNVELRLEVLSNRNDQEGSYIEYTFDGTIKNAIFYDASTDETTELQWNVETNAGYIIAPDYNNGEKACWDENFDDVSCT